MKFEVPIQKIVPTTEKTKKASHAVQVKPNFV